MRLIKIMIGVAALWMGQWAGAAAQVLIQIDGIEGTSTRAGYEGWVVANELNYNLSVSNDFSRVNRSGDMGKPRGVIRMKDIRVLKAVDEVSMDLRTMMYQGTLAQTGKIVVFSDGPFGDAQSQQVIEYALTGIFISGIDASHSDDPKETILLEIKAVTWDGMDEARSEVVQGTMAQQD